MEHFGVACSAKIEGGGAEGGPTHQSGKNHIRHASRATDEHSHKIKWWMRRHADGAERA